MASRPAPPFLLMTVHDLVALLLLQTVHNQSTMTVVVGAHVRERQPRDCVFHGASQLAREALPTEGFRGDRQRWIARSPRQVLQQRA